MACRSVGGTRSRRPMMLSRTPCSMECSVSVSRYSWSRRRMPPTSAAGRFQFAEESAKSVSVWIPRRGAASMMRRAVSAPARCPAERGSPREVAHRPLPSEMMATCKPAFAELRESPSGAAAGAGGREAGIGTTCDVPSVGAGALAGDVPRCSTGFPDSIPCPISAAVSTTKLPTTQTTLPRKANGQKKLCASPTLRGWRGSALPYD